jgi:aminoglycoside phosphotransferase (APT) family kinase protein
MGIIQHQAITPECLPEEIKALAGPVYSFTYPRQGYTSDSVILICDRGTYVVKRSPGEQYSGWLSQEYRVLQALQAIPLPVPQPLFFLQHSLSGTPEAWLMMSYLPGDSLKSVLPHMQDRTPRWHTLHAVGKALAALHRSAIPSALHAEGAEPWLESMLKQARYNLQHYDVYGSAEVLEHLERNRPQPLSPALIHGDFALDNILVLDGEVSGIVDWAWGAAGDLRYDLALVTRPKDGIFYPPEDVPPLLEGYGTTGLSQEEYGYFVSLYEFF